MTAPRTGISTVAIALSIILLLIGQQTLAVPGDTRLSATVHNAMHVPWSAIITFLLWRLTGRWSYAVAVALLIGIGSEGIQLLTGRSASLTDVISDVLGISLATALYALYHSRTRTTALLAVLVSLMITVHTLWPTGMALASHYWLVRHAPVLLDASFRRGYFLAEVTGIAEHVSDPRPGLRFTLTDRGGTGVHLREMPGLTADKRYAVLVVELTIEGDEALRLGTSMQYANTAKPIRRSQRLGPGYHELVIPVAKLSSLQSFSSGLDLFVFGHGHQSGRSFSLHRVYLR